jgi:hypothetical protein
MIDRKYSEEEVALILRRAAEVRGDEPHADAASGLSLAELKDIGAQVGIPPARIEEAALDVQRQPAPRPGTVMGIPATIGIERVVPVPLTEERLPELLHVVRNELARQGIVEEVLGGIEWKARSAMGGRYVSIRPEGGGTRIRVLGNYRDGLMGLTLGAGPIGAASIGALATALGLTGPLAVVGTALGVAGLGAVAIWRTLFRGEARALERVADALERALRASSGPAGLPAPDDPPDDA